MQFKIGNDGNRPHEFQWRQAPIHALRAGRRSAARSFAPLSFIRSCGTAEAEAEVADAVARVEPDAERGAAVTRAAAPAAAAQQTEVARCWPCRVGHRTAGVIAIPVIAPLPHVSIHISESSGIGLLPSNGMRLAVDVDAVPAHVVQVAVAAVCTRNTGPARIFPFRLGWQPSTAVQLRVYLLTRPFSPI